MKRWILLAGIVALGVAAVVVSERRKVDVSASPAALLYLVADTEQELTRMPVHFTRMSDAEEIRIGDELARMYEGPDNEVKSASTVAVERYLNQVGAPLARRAHRRLPYRFHYIPGQYMVNAFALPGGHVYVGGGLLALMDSEDELAAVIGHEIEHIDHYHCAERAQQEEALRHIPLGGLVAIPITVFEAGYSKDQELEADREGTRLAVEAGYSPNGAIRMFEAFDRLYQQYRLGGQARAKTPQEEVSRVTLETLEGYFRSHPLPSERIAQIQKLIASEGWPARSERDLAVAYVFWTARAETALKAKKYQQAEQLAQQSLKTHPDQPEAYEVLARAQFAQAEFAGAASTYRKLLEGTPRKVSYVEAYAMALAAADPRTGAAEFRAWLESAQGERERPRNADVEQAGLSLLAGDPAPAHKLEAELQLSSDSRTPDYVGELGWWYYLAGDYTQASQLLAEAVQQRPGDVKLWVHRAWAEIEIRRYSDAIQTVNNGPYEERLQGERAMAQGVASWQAQEHDEALRDLDRAVAEQPEWENPAWVKALYSPLVAQSVQEMHAERERQKKARMAEKR
jgi:beta-barrel assembly-enhancing protease